MKNKRNIDRRMKKQSKNLLYKIWIEQTQLNNDKTSKAKFILYEKVLNGCRNFVKRWLPSACKNKETNDYFTLYPCIWFNNHAYLTKAEKKKISKKKIIISVIVIDDVQWNHTMKFLNL